MQPTSVVAIEMNLLFQAQRGREAGLFPCRSSWRA
ncbi:hypothetical protein BRAO375_2230009 [Bradyrhizobium sp. ORS 375]|nr:hypothetical protein BRAO375_2230009 [Bradyrhizobium sp. ORS 375]